MKKTLLFVLMLTVIVQIFVPVYTIWEKYDVLRNGAKPLITHDQQRRLMKLMEAIVESSEKNEVICFE